MFLVGFSYSEPFPLLLDLDLVVYPSSRPLVVSISSFLLPLLASLAMAMVKEVVQRIHSGKTQSAPETGDKLFHQGQKR